MVIISYSLFNKNKFIGGISMNIMRAKKFKDILIRKKNGLSSI